MISTITVFGVRSATTLPIRLRRRVCFSSCSGAFAAAAAALAARVARAFAGATARARVAVFAAAVRVVRVVFGALFLAGTCRLGAEGALVLQRQNASDVLAGALDRAVVLQLPRRQL